MFFTNQFDGLAPLNPAEYFAESRAAWADFTKNANSIYAQGVSKLKEDGFTLKDGTESLELNKKMFDLVSKHNQAQLEYSLRLMYGMPFFVNAKEVMGKATGVAATSKTAPKAAPKASPVKAKATAQLEAEPEQKAASPKKAAVVQPKAAPTKKVDDKPELLSKPNGKADDLTKIKGIGPKLSEKLNGLGVYHFSQIAGWNTKDIAWVDESLSFKGRIDREEWIPQAKALA